MRTKPWMAMLGAVLFIGAGCARTSTLSKVNAEGQVERTVSFSLQDMNFGGGAPQSPAKYILFPKLEAWKVTNSKEKQEQVLKAVRTLKPGEVAGVDFIVNDGGNGKARCEVKAVKGADGNIVYTETYTWMGTKKPDILVNIDKQARESFEKHLAKLNPTTAQIDATLKKVGKDLRKALLGPGDPLLLALMTDTPIAARKLRAQMRLTIASALDENFSNAPKADRDEVMKSFVADMTQGLMNQKEQAQESGPTGESNSGTLVAMDVSVEGPGSVVEHNGILDPVDGQVYWSMYLDACEEEPVVLRAVFKP